MNRFQVIFNFYVQSSVHVALAVISLIFVSCKFLNINPGSYFLIFVCCSTIGTYNFVKYGVEARKYLLVSNRYHRVIQLFSGINLLIALLYVHLLNQTSWIVLAVTALMIGAYAIPVHRGVKNLRNYGILKVFLVAMVWTLITAVLPVVQYEIELTWDIYIHWIQRFLLILVLMIPFEIRDLKYDPPELKTIPQRIGVRRTKRVGYFLVMACFVITYLMDDLHPLEALSIAILSVVLIWVLAKAGKEQSKYYASFWVEGVPILWGAIVWFLDFYGAYS